MLKTKTHFRHANNRRFGETGEAGPIVMSVEFVLEQQNVFEVLHIAGVISFNQRLVKIKK